MVTMPKIKIYGPTYRNLHSESFKVRYKALKGISTRYVNNPKVRKIILEKTNGYCSECGSNKYIQIDHIVSIYRYALNKGDYRELNSYENLQPLCRSCNAKKMP